MARKSIISVLIENYDIGLEIAHIKSILRSGEVSSSTKLMMTYKLKKLKDQRKRNLKYAKSF